MTDSRQSGIDHAPAHLRDLLRHFADLHNLVFQRSYRIVPATIRTAG
jgi:hypothetical protein